jgi:S-formylglutathione hydrolase FrmB
LRNEALRGGRRFRWLLVPGVALLLVLSGIAVTGVAASKIHVLDERQLSERMVDLTVWSPALRGRTTVRLLLPTHYRDRPEARWPALYLLHGCCDSYVSWTRSTDIEQLSAASDVLVVMPDGGRVGFYSDWLNGPRWESFHTEELPQLLTSRYRASDRRAVAGNSMGGLGAVTQGYSPQPPPSAALCTPACLATSPGSTSGSSTPRVSTPTPYGEHPPWTIRSGLRTTRTISPRT